MPLFLRGAFAWYGFAYCWEGSGSFVLFVPQAPLPTPEKTRKSVSGLTPLPSLPKWEGPWESRIDLAKLRGSAAEFRTLRALAEDSRHEGVAPAVDRGAIGKLVASLDLEPELASRLTNDAALVWEWFLQPQLQARVHLGFDETLERLKSAAKWAGRFRGELELIAVQAEHVFQSMPPALKVSDDSDLLDLVSRIRQFERDAKRSLDFLNPTGRKRDSRRNVALALAVWAAEDATGQSTRISRGTVGDRPRFITPPGVFAARLLGLIGKWDEQTLVRTFERMRARLPDN